MKRAINYRSMIDDIVSGLKSGEIQSHKRCNAKEFYEKYLKGFSSKEGLQKLEASAIESATTELSDLKQVIEEIKKSNASHKMMTQNIENVKNTTNILDSLILRDTNVRRPKLLGTSRSNKENMGVLTVGMLAVVAAVPFKYWFCNRKSKGHSRSKEETPSSNLLNVITLESRDNCIN
ncbi:hypothetical protein [Wolbachia endosymbiont of Armadillidium arcangelii]|uniref:Uncharacterized protein n=1 Tax=Wolbachia endosymbiont of Armadillidium arcangelii TaxID=3158571 RepID=A0AAU7Q0H8_9RICK